MRLKRSQQARKLVRSRRHRDSPPGQVSDLVDAGVSGFVRKGASASDFLAMIRSVAQQPGAAASAVSSSVEKRYAAESLRETQEVAFGLVSLTGRERDVFALMATGRTRQQIARKLHISAGTLDRHLQRILRKVSTHDRMEDVRSKLSIRRKD